MSLELPKALTKGEWDKKKGLLNKLGTPDTGVGELLKKLETSFGQVKWEALDKQKALKEAKQDSIKLETSYRAATDEAKKAAKIAELLDEINSTASKHKSKIKQCGVVADEAKSLKSEVVKLSFLDWDDERITLREAKEELEWFIKARANALKVAKGLRKDFETHRKEAETLVEDARKALDDIQNAEIDEKRQQELLNEMITWVAQVEAYEKDDTKSFNKEFAQNSEIMKQRQSPKHDIKEALDSAGGDFNLQMTEVDAIQKALTELETLSAEVGALLEEARDVLEADKRSVEQWQTSLNKTVKELTNVVKAIRDVRAKVEGKAKRSEDAHLKFMQDKSTTKEQKQSRKLIIPAIIKEVEKQYGEFLAAADQFDAKAKRAEKVPNNVSSEQKIKPLIAAFQTLAKLVQTEREIGKKCFDQFNKNMNEALKL